MEVIANQTRLIIEPNELIAIRLIGNHQCSIIMKLNNSIDDLIDKSNKATRLSDDLFIEFDRIRREAL